MVKPIQTLLLVFLLAFAVTGCGANREDPPNDPTYSKVPLKHKPGQPRD